MATGVDRRAPSDITRALGDELRRARRLRGWTRKQLQARLASDLSVTITLQTLATYEQGTRRCSMTRLAQLCLALGVSAPELLASVQQRTVGNRPPNTFPVDLTSVAHNPHTGLTPFRRWAQDRLLHAPHGQPTVVQLDPKAMERMAELCGMSTPDLIATLRTLPPAAPGDPRTPGQRAGTMAMALATSNAGRHAAGV